MKLLKIFVLILISSTYLVELKALCEQPEESFFQEKFHQMHESDLNIPGVSQMDLDLFKEFLKGSHIVLFDNGDLFSKLHLFYEQHDSFKKRLSLHYSFYEQQFSFALHSLGVQEVLFGQAYLDTGEKITWLQAEKNSTRGFINKFWHSIDAFIYLSCLTKYNIGPYGVSSFTSKNPFYLSKEQNNLAS